MSDPEGMDLLPSKQPADEEGTDESWPELEELPSLSPEDEAPAELPDLGPELSGFNEGEVLAVDSEDETPSNTLNFPLELWDYDTGPELPEAALQGQEELVLADLPALHDLADGDDLEAEGKLSLGLELELPPILGDDQGLEGPEDSLPELAETWAPSVHSWPRETGVVLHWLRKSEGKPPLVVHREDALLFGAALERFRRDGQKAPRSARTMPLEESFASVTSVSPGRGGRLTLIAATVSGAVLASTDLGQSWELRTRLSDRSDATNSLELHASAGGILWALAHGRCLYRSADGGRSWEGPLLDHPVRCLVAREEHEDVLVLTMEHNAQLVKLQANGTVSKLGDTRLSRLQAHDSLAGHGEFIALGSYREPVLVSLDGGKSFRACAELRGLSVLAWTITNDGAPRLLGAVDSEDGSHVTLVCVSFSEQAVPQRMVRLTELGRDDASETGESPTILELRPWDPAGRELLGRTTSGLFWLGRDGAQ